MEFPIAPRKQPKDSVPVTAQELAKSAATDPTLPSGLDTTATTLWYARAGQWDAAHDLCQEIRGKAGSWIHAYLHREEGDLSNASYWYSMAGKPTPPSTKRLEDEWMEIAAELLQGK